MFVNNVIPVKDVLVRLDVAETRFLCDLTKCKGACCTLESEFGAPLLKEEVHEIQEIIPIVMEYLPLNHRQIIQENGFYDVKDDELMTKSVNNKACVFVYYEEGIARCGIEKAYTDGKIGFKKPISCHLFPIRLSKFGGDILRYEKFSECESALENGKQEDVTIMDFCKDSLIRLYGHKWYSTLREIIGK